MNLIKIGNRWDEEKRKKILYTLLFLFVIAIAVFDVILFTSYQVALKYQKISVSNLSELSNGKIFFTLEAADSVYASDYKWQEQGDSIFITIYAKRYNFFKKENLKNDLGENTYAKNNWLFQVNNSPIKKIYYTSSKKPSENNSTLIWDKNSVIMKADHKIETYVSTYPYIGNRKPGELAEMLYKAKHPYIGDMPANGRLTSDLCIQEVLGNFKTQLQTKEEPYGWTFEFEEVDKNKEAWFNQIMTKNAYVLLSLVDNLSEVTWSYQIGTETKQQSLNLEQAYKKLEKDVKSYNESPIQIQELLLKVGIE